MVTAGPRPAGHETGGTDAPPAIPYETPGGSKLMGACTNLRVYPYHTADDIMHGVYACLNTATVNPFDQYYAMQMSQITSFDPRGQSSGRKGWAAAPPAPERAPLDAEPCSSASSFPTLQSSSTRTKSAKKIRNAAAPVVRSGPRQDSTQSCVVSTQNLGSGRRARPLPTLSEWFTTGRLRSTVAGGCSTTKDVGQVRVDRRC